MRLALVRGLAVSALVLAGAGAAARMYPPSGSASSGRSALLLSPQAVLGAAAAARAPDHDHREDSPHSFYFSRAMYHGSSGWDGWKSWSTDFPKADRQFLVVLRRLTNLDAHDEEHPVRLDDPALRRFPFLYAVEAGQMRLTDEEVAGLRAFLLAGGVLMADDFWGSYEWRNFEAQMRRVLPEHPIVDLPLSHPIFHTFYNIEKILQVPNVGQGVAGGPTYEQDGYEPRVRGIVDDAGRLLVVINWNTDLGDAWEWAENPQYPLSLSTYAYQIGVNIIVYAMSH